jgi:hypothetical protein
MYKNICFYFSNFNDPVIEHCCLRKHGLKCQNFTHPEDNSAWPGHFWPNQETAAMFTLVRVDFGRKPLSSSTSSLTSRNRKYNLKTLINSALHSDKPFAPIQVFLSQIDWLWNKMLWQLSVHFHHLWRIKESVFTRYVVIRTLSKINKRNSVCERMLFDSTYLVGWPIDRSSSFI